MSRSRALVAALVVLLADMNVPHATASAAELQERTRRAYETYVERAARAFVDRVVSGTVSTSALSDGQIVARPGGEDGIIGVPGGLVHHWFGATFVPNVTLDEALGVSSSYGDYDRFYTAIVGSRVLDRAGNTYRVLLRIRESAGGITAVIDVTSRVEYFRPDAGTAYSISTSEDVREIKNAGTPREHALPAGRDSGYLWRATSLNRMVEERGGIYVEMETLGLSRRFPPMLGWFIEPLARRLGRKSVELSLREFVQALRARSAQFGEDGIRAEP